MYIRTYIHMHIYNTFILTTCKCTCAMFSGQCNTRVTQIPTLLLSNKGEAKFSLILLLILQLNY